MLLAWDGSSGTINDTRFHVVKNNGEDVRTCSSLKARLVEVE